MKSTYKLIGCFWDGLPVDANPETIAVFDAEIAVAGTPENLFDGQGVRRRMLLSDLLAAPEKETMHELIQRAKDCDELYLELDCRPKAPGAVPQIFFQKRAQQAAGFLKANAPETHVRLMYGATESLDQDD